MHDPYPIDRLLAHSHCIADQQAIDHALDTLAMQLTAQLHNKYPRVLCVLQGGLLFTAHLLSRFTFPLQYDTLSVSSYRHATRPGQLVWHTKPQLPLNNQHVLILDDIYDSGQTLRQIKSYCIQQGCRSVTTATLVRRMLPGTGTHNNHLNFHAFTINNSDFLFGFGMDLHGQCRHLYGIWAIPDAENIGNHLR